MHCDRSHDLTPAASCLTCTISFHDPTLRKIHSQPWSSDTLVNDLDIVAPDHDSLSRNPQISCTSSHRRKSSSYLYSIPEAGICRCSSSSNNICDTEGSGIWISDPLKARSNAYGTITPFSSGLSYFEEEHRTLRDVTAQIFPECVARYISHRRIVVLIRDQLRLLQVRSAMNAQDVSSKLVAESQRTLKRRLAVLMNEMKVLRNTCLQASHSLYEIDQILVVPQEEDIGSSKPHQGRIHQDMLEIRKSTLESNLLQSWTTSRDRINNWLLHSLRADDKLAQLHRSILGEPHIGEQAWARLLLKYWTLDEAATGSPLSRAQSAAATNSLHSASTQSLDFWTCNESMGSEDGLLTHVRLGQVRSELEALKRQHHRRLYKAFVDSASCETNENDDGLSLEMR